MLDLGSGEDRGRIYRLAPPNFHRRPTPEAGLRRHIDELVGLAGTSERAGIARRPTGCCSSAGPAARRRCCELCSGQDSQVRWPGCMSSGRYEGLDELDEADLLAGLDDSAAPVSRTRRAARSSRGCTVDSPALRDRLMEMTDDESPGVRFQLAFSLGSIDDPRRTAALKSIAIWDADEPWISIAVLSSAVGSRAATLARELLAGCRLRRRSGRLALLKHWRKSPARATGPKNCDEVGEVLCKLPDRLQEDAVGRVACSRMTAYVARAAASIRLGATCPEPLALVQSASWKRAGRRSKTPARRPANRVAAMRILSAAAISMRSRTSFFR